MNSMPRFTRSLIAGAFAVSIALGSLWAQPASAQKQESVSPRQVQALADLSDAFIAVAENVRPAVVNIRVEAEVEVERRMEMPEVPPGMEDHPFREFFDEFFGPNMPMPQRDMPMMGMGSGVIIDEDEGYILTNNHVVGKADEITVTLDDQREFDAELIGADENTDIAVIQINADDLIAAPLGSSADLRVGEIVLAIGSPFSQQLGNTVTQGIVSGKGRRAGILGQFGFESFIQTDAAVNPGNSGGPLVNLRGEVVGINTAIATGTGVFAGVSFAVPIDLGRKVMFDLIEHGKVIRGYLGVEIGSVTSDWAKFLDLDRPRGAVVSNVIDGGPADQAGLRELDVILEVNGRSVRNANDLTLIISGIAPGEAVEMTVLRDGEEEDIVATLVERPSNQELASAPRRGGARRGAQEEPDQATEVGKIGLTVQTVTEETARRVGMDEPRGVIITDVAPGSPAMEKGLRPRMIITNIGVDKTEVENAAQFEQLVDEEIENRGMALARVWADGRSFFVLLEPED